MPLTIANHPHPKARPKYRRILTYLVLFSFVYQQIGVASVAAGSVRVSPEKRDYTYTRTNAVIDDSWIGTVKSKDPSITESALAGSEQVSDGSWILPSKTTQQSTKKYTAPRHTMTGVTELNSAPSSPNTPNGGNTSTVYIPVGNSIPAGYTTPNGTLFSNLPGSSPSSIAPSVTIINAASVPSVFGRSGSIIGQSGDYTTDLVTEGSNLYYTQARFDTAFGLKNTDSLLEGAVNLYFSDARAQSALSGTVSGINGSIAGIGTALLGLSGDIASLSGELNTLSGSMTTVSGNLITLSGSVTTLQGNLITTNTDLSTVSGSLASLSGTVADHTNSLSSLSGSLATTNATLSSLSGNLNTLSGMLSSTTTDLTSLSGNLSALSGTIDITNTNLASTDATLASLSGTVAGINISTVTLSGSLAALLTTVSTLSGSVDGLSGDLVSLSGGLSSLSTTVLGLSTTIDTLSGTLSSLSVGVGILSGGLSNLSSTVNTLSGSLDTTNLGLGSTNSNVTLLSGGLATTNTTISTLSGVVVNLSSSLDTLSGSLAILSLDLGTLSGALVASDADIIALSGALSLLSTSVSTLSSTVTSLSGTITSLSGSLDTTNLGLSTLSLSLGTLTTTMATLSGSLDSTNLNLANLNLAMSTLSGTVSGILTSLSTLSGSLDTTNLNLSILSGSVVAIDTTVNNLSGQINTLNTTVTTLTGVVAGHTLAIAGLAGDMASLSGRVDSLSGSLDATNMGLSITNGMVASLSGDIHTLSGAVSTKLGSLNSLTGSVQWFDTGTAGTDFTIVSSGSTHTFNLPDASDIARGMVSTGSQTFTGTKTFSQAPVITGMMAGSLLFAGTGGTISQDTGNFYWDNTNKRLGIGTNTPSTSLHIQSSNTGDIVRVSNWGDSIFRVQTDTDLALDTAKVTIGKWNAAKPEWLARDQLYVYGRINSSWDSFRCDFLTPQQTITWDSFTQCGWLGYDVTTWGSLSAVNIVWISGTSRLATTAVAANYASALSSMWQLVTQRSLNPVFEARVIINTGTARSLVWFTDQGLWWRPTADTNNSNNEVFFRKAAGSASWEAVSRNSAGIETVTPTGINTAVTFKTLRIEINDLASKVYFYIDGNLVATHSSTVPDATTRLGYWVGIASSVGAVTTMDVDYIKFWSDDPDTMTPTQNNVRVPAIIDFDALKWTDILPEIVWNSRSVLKDINYIYDKSSGVSTVSWSSINEDAMTIEDYATYTANTIKRSLEKLSGKMIDTMLSVKSLCIDGVCIGSGELASIIANNITLNDRINALSGVTTPVINQYTTQVFQTESTLSGSLALSSDILALHTLLNGVSHTTIDTIPEMDNEAASVANTSRKALEYITKLLTEGIHMIRDFVAIRITALQGYFDEIWTTKIHTTELDASGATIQTITTQDIHMERLCIKKTNGSEICLNGDQVEALMGAEATVPAISENPISTPKSPSKETITEDAPTLSSSGILDSEIVATPVLVSSGSIDTTVEPESEISEPLPDEVPSSTQNPEAPTVESNSDPIPLPESESGSTL